MRIVIMGPPASGKGSQKPFLTEELNIPQISTGEMFRNEIKKGTSLGKKIEKGMSEGKLVTDELTNEIVKERLKEEDVSKGFILDGYPRTLPQAFYLDQLLKEKQLKLDYVFNLTADEDLLIKRIIGRRTCPQCGRIYNIYFLKPKVANKCDYCGATLVKRKDDTKEVIIERLKAYHEKTEPIINYYQEKAILVNIDGSKAPYDSFLEIKSAIEKSKWLF